MISIRSLNYSFVSFVSKTRIYNFNLLRTVGNVVNHHCNDVFSRHSILDQDLIGMTHIGLNNWTIDCYIAISNHEIDNSISTQEIQ